MALVILPVERPLDLIGVDNGALDAELLDPVGPRGQLHHLAARAWFALVAAAAEAGFNLTYTYGGTYRTLADQEWLFRQRYVVGGQHGGCKLWVGALWCKKLVNGKVPAAAAVPGTSNHGLGLAIDMALDNDPGDGISPDDAENVAPALGWLAANVVRFGFSWEGPADNIESWHIRYVVGDHIPQAVLDHERPPAPVPPQEDDDMAKPIFIGVEGSAGQFLWFGAGTSPLAFTDPHQRDLLLAAYELDPNKGTTISPEMFARLS